MPLFTKTISLYSARPPGALLDRIRAAAMGKFPVPRASRWRSPVMWWLREQPDAIRLMPLSPPNYRTTQPSFIGTVEPEGSGSRVRGRVAPYTPTVWITAFLLLMDAAIPGWGAVQEFSRHGLSKALPMALFGIAFGAVAVSILRVSVSWAEADIRQLLEAAASGDPHQAMEGTIQPTDAIVSKTIGRSTRGSFVLRSAAAVDLLIALFLITSSFVSSRVGRPVTLLIAAILTSGAGVFLVIAHRLGSEQRE